MARTNYNQPLTPREKEVIDHAEKYVINIFHGRGQYEKHELDLLTDAVEVGKELSKRYNKPALLYAIMGDRQAVMCSLYPNGTFSIRPEK